MSNPPRNPNEAKLTDLNPIPQPYRAAPPNMDVQNWPELFPGLDIVKFGRDRGEGSLLAIQPAMQSWHYRNQEEFTSVLNDWMTQAGDAGLLDSKTVVVFPEHIGLFLYFADEYPWVTRAKTVDAAGMLALLDEKIILGITGLRHAMDRPYAEAVRAELMKAKAPRAAEIYSHVFSSLANNFRVTVVAGSIPLPGPLIGEQGVMVRTSAHPLNDMQNVSAVFRPDGSIHPQLAVKKHPTWDESVRLWLKPRMGTPPMFDTPAGRLAVMICADAWYPDVWADSAGADIVAIPAMTLGGTSWGSPWQGYDNVEEIAGLPEPRGETLAEAWHKHALGRIKDSGAKAGVVTFLRGQIFDQVTAGRPLAWLHGQSVVQPLASRPPQAVKLWL